MFVDVRSIIPRHRAISIFEAIATTLGSKSHLWQLIALLIQGGAKGSNLLESQQSFKKSDHSTIADKDEVGFTVFNQTLTLTLTSLITEYIFWMLH